MWVLGTDAGPLAEQPALLTVSPALKSTWDSVLKITPCPLPFYGSNFDCYFHFCLHWFMLTSAHSEDNSILMQFSTVSGDAIVSLTWKGRLGVMGFVHTFPTKDRVTGWPLLPTINCSFQYPGKADATRVHILHQEAVRQVKHWTQSVWSLPGSCRLHYPILDVYDIVSVILKYNKAVLIP